MEDWYPVRGWEGLYEITKGGRVRSLDRVVKSANGRRYFKKGQEMKTYRAGSRYPGVMFSHEGRVEDIQLHRLLAQMFIPNPDNLPVVRHLNDDARDYRLENLAWGTQKDNLYDIFNNRGHYNSQKTHCKNGHPFDEENTYITRSGGRTCRTCRDAAVAKSQGKLVSMEPKRHGTIGAYRWNKCRCDVCVEFYKGHLKRSNERAREKRKNNGD